ncbi:hypothetical protein PG987_011254 [Apiospora arundinis]
MSSPSNLLPLSSYYHQHRRPLDHIESERQYLQDQLDEQDRQACDLFSQIAAADMEAEDACVYPEFRRPDRKRRRKARKARKHCSWLQFRIDEVVERERQIIAQLGVIHMEIQCLERWQMVEQLKVHLKQQQGWGWRQGWTCYDDDVLDEPRWKHGLEVDSSYRQHLFGPTTSANTTIRRYTRQQQHQRVLSANYHRPSMAVNPRVPYPDSWRPTRTDRRHRRSIPRTVKVHYVQRIPAEDVSGEEVSETLK